MREPGFESRKLPASVSDLLKNLQRLPVPELKQFSVDIQKRKQGGEVSIVDSKEVFYLDVEATLRRCFADPMVVKTLELRERDLSPVATQSQFLDSSFSRDPTRVTKLVSVPFRVWSPAEARRHR